jgi:hypothetical protein
MSNKASVALLAAAIFLLTALPTSAATRSSIRLVVPTTAGAAATTAPSFGTQVTFDLTTTASFPWVDTKCSQNGQLVYEQWAGFFDSYAGSKMFTLGPTQLWSGGAANCTATLVTYDKNGRPTKLATTSFDVAA